MMINLYFITDAYATSDIQFYLKGGADKAVTGFDELSHPEFKVLSMDTTVQNISLNTGVCKGKLNGVHYLYQ